jgi:hypothetical protein
MATRTRVTLTCDMCGDAEDVQTRTIGLDGITYEIDLCPADSRRLSQVAAGYVPKARKTTAWRGRRHPGARPRSRAGTGASGGRARQSGRQASGRGRATGSAQDKAWPGRSKQQAANGGGARARAAGPTGGQARGSGLKQHKAKAASGQAAAAGPRQDKGIYVYGILPADVEMTAEMPGVGESPGLLRVVRRGGLAALISEVDLSGRLGSPDDLRAHREILDATAAEVPVVPLPPGAVLASEDAVAGELLAARREQFAAALDQLEGRAEFVVQGRYLEQPVPAEGLSQDEHAARPPDTTRGQHPGAARDARTGPSAISSAAVGARREQDTRALEQAMAGHCVASAVRQPAHDLDAVHVAFLVEAGQRSDMQRVVEDLARAWQGRIEVQLLGPMAAYDFTATAKPEG